MATLRTDYQDDILDTSVNLRRKYQITENADETVSFEDVTTYTQQGDVIDAADLNAITAQINTNGLQIVANTDAIASQASSFNIFKSSTLTSLGTLQREIEDLDDGLDLKVNMPIQSGTGGGVDYGQAGQVLKTNGDGTNFWGNEAGGGGGGIEESNTTTFASNVITQTFVNGDVKTTTFNANGTITEVFTEDATGTVTTSTTTFNNDGSISVVTVVS